ncbi:MAG: DUF1150 domain-containing protein [Rhodospirillales bacterium]
MNVSSEKMPESVVTISVEDLLQMGVNEIAAIRMIETDSGRAYGIFSANGVQLGSAPTRDIARAAAVQNDLHPVDIN